MAEIRLCPICNEIGLNENEHFVCEVCLEDEPHASAQAIDLFLDEDRIKENIDFVKGLYDED